MLAFAIGCGRPDVTGTWRGELTERGETTPLELELKSENGKVFGKPALIYDRYNTVVRWILMPVNAGLEVTRENLGSNYPEHLDAEEDQEESCSATEVA